MATSARTPTRAFVTVQFEILRGDSAGLTVLRQLLDQVGCPDGGHVQARDHGARGAVRRGPEVVLPELPLRAYIQPVGIDCVDHRQRYVLPLFLRMPRTPRRYGLVHAAPQNRCHGRQRCARATLLKLGVDRRGWRLQLDGHAEKRAVEDRGRGRRVPDGDLAFHRPAARVCEPGRLQLERAGAEF